MARVLMLSTSPEDDGRFTRTDYERLERAAREDRFGVHSLTEDPHEAELILFVGYAEQGAADIRRHPYLRAHREKAFVFDSGDAPLPLVPGVYVCGDRRWSSPQRVRGGFYLRTFDNETIQCEPLPDDALLFSFVGRVSSHPVRLAIVELRHPRALVRDVDAGQSDDVSRATSYFDVIRKSKFVLCPRGIGTSTWRLFETLKAGRVPVIVSDDWIPPIGPDWASCSLRVAEGDVASIPAILEQHEARFESMARAAREVWLEWGGLDVAFHRIVEWCLDIQRTRTRSESLLRFGVYPHLLRPFYFRHVVLGGIKRAAVRAFRR